VLELDSTHAGAREHFGERLRAVIAFQPQEIGPQERCTQLLPPAPRGG
jgi:hypothetical protein